MPVIEHVKAMTRFGIPVMGHVGMMPQSVNQSGGYHVQGHRTRQKLKGSCKKLKHSKQRGHLLLVLECVSSLLAKHDYPGTWLFPPLVSERGHGCDGQVLVLYDLLGLFDDFVPKFVKPYAHLKADALQALKTI